MIISPVGVANHKRESKINEQTKVNLSRSRNFIKCEFTIITITIKATSYIKTIDHLRVEIIKP